MDTSPKISLEGGEGTPLIPKKNVRVAAALITQEDSDGELALTESHQWFREPSINWILPALLLHCLAVGATAVPKITIILNILCYQHRPSLGFQPKWMPTSPTDASCRVPILQSQLGRFMLFANMTSGFLCAISSPRLCTLSNRYGRTTMMALTASGMLFGDIISILAGIFPNTISAYWILLEFAFGGLSGTLVATIALAQTYAADCTSPKARSNAFGLIHACMYVGAALGPLVGGILQHYLFHGNLAAILGAAAVCHVIFISFVLLAVPESLPLSKICLDQPDFRGHTELVEAESSQKKTTSLLSIGRSFFRPLSILYPVATTDSARTVRRNLILLSIIDAVTFGILLSSTHLLILYSTYKFNLGSLQTNILISTTNLVRVISLIVLLPLLSRILGSETTIKVSLLSAAICTTLLAFSTTYPTFTLVAALASLSAVTPPTAQAVLTTLVPQHKSSELMGAVSLMHALTRITLPPLLDLVYSLSIGKGFDGVVFISIAAMFATAWLLSTFVHGRAPGSDF